MPLSIGSSKKVISSNIGEMLHKFKTSGMIGNTQPDSMANAKAIAAAAAFRKAGEKKNNWNKE